MKWTILCEGWTTAFMRTGELGGWSAIRWVVEMQLKMSLLENVEVIRIIGMLSNVFEPIIVLLLKTPSFFLSSVSKCCILYQAVG